MSEFARVAEWDWVYTTTDGGRRLHHLAEIRNRDTVDEDWYADGLSTCGLDKEWEIPGVMSRLGMPRCARCCDRLGIPRGDGSPKNDPTLRAFVEARLTPDSAVPTQEEGHE